MKSSFQMKEYKVLSQTDKWFNGRFSPDKLESVLNMLSRQGWTVVSMTSASINIGMGGPRDEIVIIMERFMREDKPAPHVTEEKKQVTEDVPALPSNRAPVWRG